MPVEKATFVFQRTWKSNFSFSATFSALFSNRSFTNGTPRLQNSREWGEIVYFWSWVAATTFCFHMFIHTFNTRFILLPSAREFFFFLRYQTPYQVHQREGFCNYPSLNECPEHIDNAIFIGETNDTTSKLFILPTFLLKQTIHGNQPNAQ